MWTKFNIQVDRNEAWVLFFILVWLSVQLGNCLKSWIRLREVFESWENLKLRWRHFTAQQCKYLIAKFIFNTPVGFIVVFIQTLALAELHKVLNTASVCALEIFFYRMFGLNYQRGLEKTVAFIVRHCGVNWSAYKLRQFTRRSRKSFV